MKRQRLLDCRHRIGKTTIANKVYEASKPFRKRCLYQAHDYYRLNLSGTGVRSAINFDHPDAHDSKRLVNLLKLKSGKTIYKPT